MSRLRSRLADLPAPPTGARMWMLGQAGIAVRSAGPLVLIDPYLSDWLERPSAANPQPVVRARPAPLSPDEVPPPDLVLCTHEHPDHLDPGTISVLAARSDTTTFVVPAPLVAEVQALGVPSRRVIGAVAGECIQAAGIEVLALPSAHAFHPDAFGGYTFWTDESGRHRALGYVLSLGGVRLYHSGDTVYWPDLDARLRELSIDVGVLPINGRDWKRERAGLVGNLDGREAADLAVAARFRLVVPCHYDGIVGNTGDVHAFVRYLTATYPEQRYALPDDDGLVIAP